MKKAIFLLLLFISVNLLFTNNSKIDSLCTELELANDSEKIDILNILAGNYWELSPNERIPFAQQMLGLADKLQDQSSIANAYNYLGIAYNQLDETQRSLDYFHEALDIFEEINDENGIARTFLNLSQVNVYLNNFDKALEYSQKNLAINKKIADKKGISKALNGIGTIMAITEQYDAALDFLSQSLEIKNEIDDKMGISQIYNNIGNVYLALGEMNKVMEYRLKSLEIVRELDNKWEIALTTYNIAEYYLTNDEPDKAYPYLLETQELAEMLNNQGLIRDNTNFYSWYYELKKDYPKAIKYLKDYSKLTKQQFSEELSETTAEMQVKYETEKKERENEEYKLQLEKIHSQRMLLALSLIITFLIVLFIYYRYRIKKRSAILLEILVAERTQELKQNFNELEQAKQQIQKDLEIQTALIQEIYHRTKNNMAVISAMLSMQSRRSENDYVKSTFREISNKIQAMSLVHQKLYKAKDLSNINLKDYIEDLANLIMQSFGVLSARIKMKFDLQDVKILIDSAVPLGLIINELVSNIFKHAFPENQEGEIFIRLFEEENETINLELIDNGIGFPQNFDPRKNGSMGLTSVFSIAENQLKGEISVKSENGLKWHIKIKDDKKKERI